MPFTPSHVAAVLPLTGRTWAGRVLPATGLVIGSMVPDLPYYLPTQLVGLPIDSAFTHRLSGVLSLDLAMGLVCVALWHGVLGPAAVRLAPDGVRRRLPAGVPAPVGALIARPRQLAALVLALVIGAITHIVWDSFTHVGRFGPRHIEWLATAHGPLAGYRWAQYGSGVFGAVVIGLWAWRWWRTRTPDDATVWDVAEDTQPALAHALPLRARLGVLGAVAAGLVAGALAGVVTGVQQSAGPRHTVFMIATSSGGTAAAVALLSAVVIRISA